MSSYLQLNLFFVFLHNFISMIWNPGIRSMNTQSPIAGASTELIHSIAALTYEQHFNKTKSQWDRLAAF